MEVHCGQKLEDRNTNFQRKEYFKFHKAMSATTDPALQ